MKLATFNLQGKTAIGAVLDHERIVVFEGQSSMLDFISAGPGAVTVNDVSFRYAEAGALILDGISLEVAPGAWAEIML